MIESDAGRSEEAFLASTVTGLLLYIFSAPIRAQMTRCVSSSELGKVSVMHSRYLSLIGGDH